MAREAGTRAETTVALTRLLREGGSRRVGSLLAVALAQATVPLLIISTAGTLVARAATGPTLGAVVSPLVTLAALFALQQILSPIAGILGYRVSSAIDGAMRAQAMEAATRPVGVGFLEDEGVQDLIELGAGRPIVFRSATPGGAAVGVIGVTTRYLQGIGAAALIARFSPPLAVLLLVATFSVRRVIHRANVAQAATFDDHVPT